MPETEENNNGGRARSYFANLTGKGADAYFDHVEDPKYRSVQYGDKNVLTPHYVFKTNAKKSGIGYDVDPIMLGKFTANGQTFYKVRVPDSEVQGQMRDLYINGSEIGSTVFNNEYMPLGETVSQEGSEMTADAALYHDTSPGNWRKYLSQEDAETLITGKNGVIYRVPKGTPRTQEDYNNPEAFGGVSTLDGVTAYSAVESPKVRQYLLDIVLPKDIKEDPMYTPLKSIPASLPIRDAYIPYKFNTRIPDTPDVTKGLVLQPRSTPIQSPRRRHFARGGSMPTQQKKPSPEWICNNLHFIKLIHKTYKIAANS